MQSIKIICIGKLKEAFYEQAVKEYTKRLASLCKLEIEELPEVKLSQEPSQAEIDAALLKEGEAVKSRIPKGSAVVAMCIEGKGMSSEGFAELLENFALSGSSKICFIIGGSFGLSKDVKALAQVKLSMSAMTFPHHLARIMVLEQLYRAEAIQAGSKYHK